MVSSFIGMPAREQARRIDPAAMVVGCLPSMTEAAFFAIPAAPIFTHSGRSSCRRAQKRSTSEETSIGGTVALGSIFSSDL